MSEKPKMQNARPIDWRSSEYYACAYVSREDVGDYYCLLCDRRLLGDDELCAHVNSERHTAYVRQRGSYLTAMANDSYYCSHCRCVIGDYTKINRHFNAGNHYMNVVEASGARKAILGWDSSEKFACPYVLRRDNDEYYCLVCGYVAVGDRAFDSHVRGKYHKDSVLYRGQHISPSERNAFYCGVCDRKIYYYTAVYAHLLGRSHKEKLSEESKRKSPKPQAVEWSACEYFVCPFVSEAPDGRFYCVICDEALGDKNIFEDHTKSVRHTTAVKRANFVFPLEHCYSYCECCDMILPYRHMIRSHVENPRHKYHCEAREKLEKQRADRTKRDRFVRPFVSRESNGEYYCVLCDSSIFGDEALNAHPREISHLSAMKTNGAYVKALGGESFYCECCECAISDYRKIFEHSNEKTHVSMREKRERVKSMEETSRVEISRAEDRATNHSCSKLTYAASSRTSEEGENSGYTPVAITKEERETGMNSVTPKCASDRRNSVETLKSIVSLWESSSITETATTKRKNDSATISPSSEKTTNLEDSGYEETPRESVAPRAARIAESKKTFDPREIVELTDYCEDIYETEDRLREIKLGLDLCFLTETLDHYCLVCREIVDKTTEKYVEHLGDPEHCGYLESMMRDHAERGNDDGESSELYLAHHYMVNLSESETRCIVCNEDINRVGDSLNDHIDRDEHSMRCAAMRARTSRNFEAVASRIARCDWYKIERYRCEPCSLSFDTEIKFASHLRGRQHEIHLGQMKSTGEVPIYDFCELCALMWYGYRCTYAAHCNGLSHKWFAREGYYIPNELPVLANKFLSMSRTYLTHTMDYLHDQFAREKINNETLLNDLSLALRSKFSGVNAHSFGSRLFASKSPNKCIDVFVSWESINEGKTSSDRTILDFMTIAYQCLQADPVRWEPKDFVTIGHSSVIEARHIATGVSCEIFFESGLSVKSTKLIRFFNDIFPPCEKLLLFLKEWLAHCDLSGHRRISCYALYWLMIFYLQKESILPSVASLIAIEDSPLKNGGTHIGGFDNLMMNGSRASATIKELVIRFFMFYASFDFRHDVASPSLGDVLKKRAFAYPNDFPKEMASYIDYIKKSDNPKPFEIECPMCVQDPLVHERNLTRDLNKLDLIRFRACCCQSIYLLGSA